MSVKFVNNVLVPGWILLFGLVSLSYPPPGVAASVGLFLVGAFVVPALMLMPRMRPPAPVLSPAATV